MRLIDHALLLCIVVGLAVWFWPSGGEWQRNVQGAHKEEGKAVLVGPRDGELLIRHGGELWIMLDGASSGSLAAGTQRVPQGAGIALHRHMVADEILYVLEGSADGLLRGGDGKRTERRALERGSLLYVPRGSWHGIDNPLDNVTLLWVVSPPGLEGFFRDVASPFGDPTFLLTPEEMKEILHKHQME
ncbi:MAG: cupin domain-containing protein [archaeon]|nr:cupin domain-containing protein [archaeon]